MSETNIGGDSTRHYACDNRSDRVERTPRNTETGVPLECYEGHNQLIS